MSDQSMKVIQKDAPANHYDDSQIKEKLLRISYDEKVSLLYQMEDLLRHQSAP